MQHHDKTSTSIRAAIMPVVDNPYEMGWKFIIDQDWSDTLSPPMSLTELDVDCSRGCEGLYMQKAVFPSQPFIINYLAALSPYSQ